MGYGKYTLKMTTHLRDLLNRVGNKMAAVEVKSERFFQII